MYVYYIVHTYVHMCMACTILQMLTIVAHFFITWTFMVIMQVCVECHSKLVGKLDSLSVAKAWSQLLPLLIKLVCFHDHSCSPF